MDHSERQHYVYGIILLIVGSLAVGFFTLRVYNDSSRSGDVATYQRSLPLSASVQESQVEVFVWPEKSQ